MQNNSRGATRQDPFKRDIDVIACRLARDESTRDDLRQEMRVCLLSLPAGKPQQFYRAALKRCAFAYWAHAVVDAPSDRCGRPILSRRTRCVGGLAELDRIHQHRAA